MPTVANEVQVVLDLTVDFLPEEGVDRVSCKVPAIAVGAEMAQADCIASDGPMKPVTLACRWPAK